jgi:sulfite reductase alpha subunit-like flavoprotein
LEVNHWIVLSFLLTHNLEIDRLTPARDFEKNSNQTFTHFELFVSMSNNNHPKKLLVLYGSETGNCEAISKRIHQEAGEKGYSSRWFALNSYREVSILITKGRHSFRIWRDAG